MDIPQVTKEKPYIQFKFDNDTGKLSLCISDCWWGGIDEGFYSLSSQGNTCLPEDLDEYINAFKKRKVNNIKEQIKKLQQQLKNYAIMIIERECSVNNLDRWTMIVSEIRTVVDPVTAVELIINHGLTDTVLFHEITDTVINTIKYYKKDK